MYLDIQEVIEFPRAAPSPTEFADEPTLRIITKQTLILVVHYVIIAINNKNIIYAAKDGIIVFQTNNLNTFDSIMQRRNGTCLLKQDKRNIYFFFLACPEEQERRKKHEYHLFTYSHNNLHNILYIYHEHKC